MKETRSEVLRLRSGLKADRNSAQNDFVFCFLRHPAKDSLSENRLHVGPLRGGKDQAQAGQQNLAAGALEDIDSAITDLAALRRKVQLAADQAWPWRTDGVATIRKTFFLPTDRQFTD